MAWPPLAARQGFLATQDCSLISEGEALVEMASTPASSLALLEKGTLLVFVKMLLLRALVSATSSLLISDKLLRFSFALPTFKWGKIILPTGSEKL